MAPERVNDLRAFKDFVEEKLSNGVSDLTPEEALLHLESENQSDEEMEETREAIRQGIADMEAGRIRPARQVLEEIRRKRNLPRSHVR